MDQWATLGRPGQVGPQWDPPEPSRTFRHSAEKFPNFSGTLKSTCHI